ncbi:MAG: hypothetical protein IOC82_14135 [Aestuariivirga sp.]|uniref:hypothetical protein n=1 Tax=Aestuariivirga sp. TaxID=2650926 RepID=UPI0025C25288|nr:hypothetical protein [Aestuariivirga sp.]MCA3562158.1 hypothetical protein [Aestuariivirga sp.]
MSNLQDRRGLKPTLDLRALFKGLLMDHMGVPPTLLASQIFPGGADMSPLRGLIKGGTAPAVASAACWCKAAATGAGRSGAFEHFRSGNGAIEN